MFPFLVKKKKIMDLLDIFFPAKCDISLDSYASFPLSGTGPYPGILCCLFPM